MGLQFTSLMREFACPLERKGKMLYSMRKRCTQAQVDYLQQSIDAKIECVSVNMAQMSTSWTESTCTGHMSSASVDASDDIQPVMIRIYISAVKHLPNFIEIDHLINTDGMDMGCSSREDEVLVLPGLRLTYLDMHLHDEYETMHNQHRRCGVSVYAEYTLNHPNDLPKKILLNSNAVCIRNTLTVTDNVWG